MNTEKTRAIIYSRCSTDESRQTTEIQLQELRRFVHAHGWEFDEVSEYGSGFKEEQPKLREVIEKIRRGYYQIMVVHSLDRLSRAQPRKVNEMLDAIVYSYSCRFLSMKENLDSQNEMTWVIIRNLFIYFANQFSRQLSEKIRAGIKLKKMRGEYRGGGRRKEVDIERLKAIVATKGRLSLREVEAEYNVGISQKSKRISYQTVRRLLPTLLQQHIQNRPS